MTNNKHTGIVKWFDTKKGYGFIKPQDGTNDVFVHITELTKAAIRNLVENQKVLYEVQKDNRGKVSAVNLELA